MYPDTASLLQVTLTSLMHSTHSVFFWWFQSSEWIRLVFYLLKSEAPWPQFSLFTKESQESHDNVGSSGPSTLVCLGTLGWVVDTALKSLVSRPTLFRLHLGDLGSLRHLWARSPRFSPRPHTLTPSRSGQPFFFTFQLHSKSPEVRQQRIWHSPTQVQ